MKDIYQPRATIFGGSGVRSHRPFEGQLHLRWSVDGEASLVFEPAPGTSEDWPSPFSVRSSTKAMAVPRSQVRKAPVLERIVSHA